MRGLLLSVHLLLLRRIDEERRIHGKRFLYTIGITFSAHGLRNQVSSPLSDFSIQTRYDRNGLYTSELRLRRELQAIL
jgi:hypothetical protein